MPTYDYECPKCNRTFEHTHRIADTAPRFCPIDEYPLTKTISAPRVMGDYPGYQCPATGKWIEGRRAHEENLRRQGCHVRETGEGEALARRRAEADEELGRIAEQAAVDFVNTAPPEKVAVLAGELERGGDAIFQRKTV